MSILRSLSRDDAIRRLPLWTVITALNTSVLVGSIVFGAARAAHAAGAAGTAVPIERFVFPLWLAVAFYLAFGPVRTRCRPLDLALPLSARRLWLIHTAANALAGVVLLAASAAVVTAYGSVVKQPWASWSGAGLLALFIHVAAATALAVVLLQSARLHAWRVPVTIGWVLLLGAVLLGLLGWCLWTAGGSPALALIPGALAVALGAWTYRAVPPAFDLLPAAGRAGAATARPHTADTAEAGPTPRRTAWSAAGSTPGDARPGRSRWPILLRILYNVPPWGPFTLVVLCLFIALGGALLSNGAAAWVPDVDMRLIFLPFTVYIMFSILGPLTYRLQHLDPLPVGRKALLAALLMPLAAALLSGYGAGWAAELVARPDQVQFHVLASRGKIDRWVHVPPGYLEIVPAADVPALTAPWGETHPASSAPLSRRHPDGPTIYSPYNTPDESSAAFEAWLLSRAIEAVYGRSLPPDEIVARFFVVEGDRVMGIRDGGSGLRAALTGLAPERRRADPAVILALTAVPFLLLAALFFTTFRARIGDGVRKATFWSVLAVAMAAMIAHIPLAELGVLDLLGTRVLFDKLLFALARTPEVLAATWAGTAVAVVAAYLLAQRQFLRVELPAQPSKFTLFDWESPTA